MPIERPTILIVDDEPTLRRILTRLLEQHFLVIEADNGASALQAAWRIGPSLSLIITDISMPIMNGIDFARAVRRKHPRVPILFITGDPATVADVGGRTTVLPKPFGPDLFLATITRLLAHTPTARPLFASDLVT